MHKINRSGICKTSASTYIYVWVCIDINMYMYNSYCIYSLCLSLCGYIIPILYLHSEKRHFNAHTILFLYLHIKKNIIFKKNIMWMWICIWVCMCSHSIIVLLTLGVCRFLAGANSFGSLKKAKKEIH